MTCPLCPPIPPPVKRIWDPHGDAEQVRTYWAACPELGLSIAFQWHGQGFEAEATRRLGFLPILTARLL